MISVVVPVYKVQDYLQYCIESIIGQTYSEFELILVDDGSPDNCGAICDEYAKKDNRIKVIHQENGGLSAARNAGIDIAEGEYITFVDSDDLIAEKYLETLYNAIVSTSSDITTCKMFEFEDGIVPLLDKSDAKSYEIMDGRAACRSIYCIDGKISIVSCGKLYKKDLFDEVRFPVGMIHEDNAVTPYVCYKADKIVAVNEALYFYRQRKESITSDAFSLKRYDQIAATDLCIKLFSANNDKEMVRLAKRYQTIIRSKSEIFAYKSGKSDEVPLKYRMSRFRALINLHRYVSQSLFEWYLSLAYPGLVKPYSYAEKIVSTLRKGKKT